MNFKGRLLKKGILCFALSLLGQIAPALIAQTVQLLPMNGMNEYFFMDQLWDVQLLATKAVAGNLEIRIEQGNSSARILTATSAAMPLKVGANTLSTAARASMSLNYGATAAAASLRQTGKLPFGQYTLCYTFRDAAGLNLGIWCQEKTIRPLSPPELVSPNDQSLVETTQPFLMWRAPFPLQNEGLEYNIRLTEVPAGMNPAEALRTRPPHLNLSRQRDPFLPYPLIGKPLENGKTYAWQVSALSGNFDLGVTDIWSFKVKTPAPDTLKKQTASYCWLKSSDDGTYCQSVDSLKFVYQNNTGDATLQYSITDPNNQVLKIAYPTVKLQPGMNQLTLPFNQLGEITINQSYRLEVISKEGERFLLPFRRLRE
ncbi:MAG: hypothetical protein RLZZ628_610 [Bacteroidota bacterium]|jgi:hypothetical protein